MTSGFGALLTVLTVRIKSRLAPSNRRYSNKPMKLTNSKILALVFGALLLQGCVAFPPLVQVEHKHAAPPPGPASNDEVLRRLDTIDQRLQKLEQTPPQR